MKFNDNSLAMLNVDAFFIDFYVDMFLWFTRVSSDFHWSDIVEFLRRTIVKDER